MCELYVYRDGVRIGMVEGIESLQWLVEFRGAGEFNLLCAATAANRALLRQWDTLYNPDTPDVAAVILYLQSKIDAKGAAVLQVRGQFSVCRWAQRVVLGSAEVSDAAAGIVSLASANRRGLPCEVLPTDITAPCSETVEWGSCLDAFMQLAEAAGIGFSVRFDPLSAQESLVVLAGTDRSNSGTEAYVGCFSSEMQNLSEVSVTLDGSDCANVILCGGAVQEGEKRLIVEVGSLAATGAQRRELWVDGSGVSRQYQQQAGDGTLTTAEYTDAEYEVVLKHYAAGALLNHLNRTQIKATAEDTALAYGRDYALGDTLPVVEPALGLRAKAQVTAVRLIYEGASRVLQPVFGNFTMF